MPQNDIYIILNRITEINYGQFPTPTSKTFFTVTLVLKQNLRDKKPGELSRTNQYDPPVIDTSRTIFVTYNEEKNICISVKALFGQSILLAESKHVNFLISSPPLKPEGNYISCFLILNSSIPTPHHTHTTSSTNRISFMGQKSKPTQIIVRILVIKVNAYWRS